MIEKEWTREVEEGVYANVSIRLNATQILSQGVAVELCIRDEYLMNADK